MKQILSTIMVSILLLASVPVEAIFMSVPESTTFHTTHELIQNTKVHPGFLRSYMQQFGMKKHEVMSYLSTLRLSQLKKNVVTPLYHLNSPKGIPAQFVELHKGGYVWVDLGGNRAIDAQNGYPITSFTNVIQAHPLVQNTALLQQNTSTGSGFESTAGPQPGIVTNTNTLLPDTGIYEPSLSGLPITGYGNGSSSSLFQFPQGSQSGIITNTNTLLPYTGIVEPSFTGLPFFGSSGGGAGGLTGLGGLAGGLGGLGIIGGVIGRAGGGAPSPVPEFMTVVPFIIGLGWLFIGNARRKSHLKEQLKHPI